MSSNFLLKLSDVDGALFCDRPIVKRLAGSSMKTNYLYSSFSEEIANSNLLSLIWSVQFDFNIPINAKILR